MTHFWNWCGHLSLILSCLREYICSYLTLSTLEPAPNPNTSFESLPRSPFPGGWGETSKHPALARNSCVSQDCYWSIEQHVGTKQDRRKRQWQAFQRKSKQGVQGHRMRLRKTLFVTEGEQFSWLVVFLTKNVKLLRCLPINITLLTWNSAGVADGLLINTGICLPV